MARAEKLKELMTQRDALTAEQVQTPEDLSKTLFIYLFRQWKNILKKPLKNQTFAFEFEIFCLFTFILVKLLFLSSPVRSLLLAVGGGVCVILLMYIFPATIGVSRDQEL